MNHAIVIRSAYGPEYPLEANRRRLEITRRVCVPSLCCAPVIVSVRMDDPLAEERDAAFRTKVWSYTINGLTNAMRWIWEWGGDAKVWYMTRLDDDDALAADFIQRLHSAIERHPDAEWFTFPRGVRVQGRRYRECVQHNNQFLTRRCRPGESVYDVKHGDVRDAVVVDDKIAWAFYRHPDTRTKSKLRGETRDVAELKGMFNVEWP